MCRRWSQSRRTFREKRCRKRWIRSRSETRKKLTKRWRLGAEKDTSYPRVNYRQKHLEQEQMGRLEHLILLGLVMVTKTHPTHVAVAQAPTAWGLNTASVWLHERFCRHSAEMCGCGCGCGCVPIMIHAYRQSHRNVAGSPTRPVGSILVP